MGGGGGAPAHGGPGLMPSSLIFVCQLLLESHTIYTLKGFGKSTQNRQLGVITSNSKKQVDDFVGKLTF